MSHPEFLKLAVPGVRGLTPYVPGKPIEELERELGLSNSIKLASNENPLGPPASALAAIRASASDVALYPDGSAYQLRSALAEALSLRPEAITLGNGSCDVLVMLAETFLAPGVEAVFSQYAFVLYALVTQAAGATARVAPARPRSDSQPLGHDLSAMRSLVGPATRLVFIANPNNPTGSWLTASELRDFVSSLPQEVIVVVDEAYCEYVEDTDYPDCSRWLAEFPNLVVTRTFSKIHALAGLRVGYALSHPALAELLNRVRQPFNVSLPAQRAALASLRDRNHVTRSREVNRAGLRQLAEGLDRLGLTTFPSRGNFLLVACGDQAGHYYEQLLRAGIIVRPVANYGLQDCLRITVGLPEQNEQLLASLSDIMSR